MTWTNWKAMSEERKKVAATRLAVGVEFERLRQVETEASKAATAARRAEMAAITARSDFGAVYGHTRPQRFNPTPDVEERITATLVELVESAMNGNPVTQAACTAMGIPYEGDGLAGWLSTATPLEELEAEVREKERQQAIMDEDRKAKEAAKAVKPADPPTQQTV